MVWKNRPRPCKGQCQHHHHLLPRIVPIVPTIPRQTHLSPAPVWTSTRGRLPVLDPRPKRLHQIGSFCRPSPGLGARDLTSQAPATTIHIYTTDHRILSYILTTARHDNVVISQSICDTMVDILFTHTGYLEIGWVPASMGFRPICRLKLLAAAAPS